MRISQIVGDEVVCVAGDADLLAVADALTGNDVGLVVVGSPDDVKGVVSERDLVRALAQRRDPASVRAIDVANTDLVWCDAHAKLSEVATEMMDRYVRHILVEKEGRLVGVASARDLLGVFAAR